jgi:hypothetical protein
VDGKAEQSFPRSFSIQSGVGQIAFSPDGSKAAWVAPLKANVAVYVNGTPGKEYYSVRELRFAADGTPTYLASTPQAPLQYARVRGAQESAPAAADAFPGRGPKCAPFNGPIVFSPDGRRYAYPQIGAAGSFVVVDGKNGPSSSQLGKPLFSADGKHVAYWGALTVRDRLNSLFAERRVMVLDGKPLEEFDAVSEPAFAPDGRELRYFAIQGQEILLKKVPLR